MASLRTSRARSCRPPPASACSSAATRCPPSARPLTDYITIANLYQPCAALAPAASMSEASFYNFMALTAMNTRAANRCAASPRSGLVAGSSAAEQAADALRKLHAYGWSAEHDTMHNAHYGLGNAPICRQMYTNAFGRFSVADNVCGTSLRPPMQR